MTETGSEQFVILVEKLVLSGSVPLNCAITAVWEKDGRVAV